MAKKNAHYTDDRRLKLAVKLSNDGLTDLAEDQ